MAGDRRVPRTGAAECRAGRRAASCRGAVPGAFFDLGSALRGAAGDGSQHRLTAIHIAGRTTGSSRELMLPERAGGFCAALARAPPVADPRFAVWHSRSPRHAATADAEEQIRSLTHVNAMTIEPVHQLLWL